MKILKKVWGIGLVLILAASLLLAAAPAQAADPLNWENKTDAPSAIPFNTLAPGTDIVDYDINGSTMYAITRSYLGVNALVTTAFDGTVTYTFNYTNQFGTAGRVGTIAFDTNAATTTVAITLQPGDTLADVDNANATSVAGTATAGAFTIQNTASTALATFVFAGTITDAAINVQSEALMQSATAGAMFSNITNRIPAAFLAAIPSLDYVAIAPDNASVVVIATNAPAAGVGMAISIDGGLSWSSMGTIQDAAGVVAAGLNGIAVAPVVSGGTRYIVGYGNDAGGAALYYYNYGSGVGAWRDAVANFTGLVGAPATHLRVVGFAFSPVFMADYMAVALTTNGPTGIGDVLQFHQLSFNLNGSWNTEAGYPRAAYTTTAGALTVTKASIALVPTYDGADDSSRVAFFGLNMAEAVTGDVSGIMRAFDSNPPAYILGGAANPIQINSVATDGTNLAAGQFDNNNVWKTDGALSGTPTFQGTQTLKRIGVDVVGINEMTIVKNAGETLYGATNGMGSAISKSTDFGRTWNDYALLDSALTTIDDIYMTPGGSPWYISAHDGATSSVYRVSGGVTRVLCVVEAAGVPDLNLRGLDTDPDIVYAFDQGGTALYYTGDGGMQRWFLRGAVPAAITDLAVDSASTIFMGSGTSVYKSINTGFTWGTPVDSKLSGANVVHNMAALGDGQVVIGGSAGGVTYTKDSGDTWTAALGVFNTFSPVLVAASGLEDGNFIFAAETVGNQVWRCSMSPDNFLGQFLTMDMPAAAGYNNTGVRYQDGVLYVLSTDGVNNNLVRSLAPNLPGNHTAPVWGTVYNEAGIYNVITPNALRSAKVTDDIYLYSVGTGVVYFQDTLSLNKPVILTPVDGLHVQIVSAILGQPQDIQVTFNRLSLSTSYAIQLALDENFTQVVSTDPFNSAAPLVSRVITPGANNYSAGNTYYMRVRATAPTNSAWSAPIHFTVQQVAATVPEIASPANGAVITSNAPAFSWTPIASATSYSFELSDSPTFATTIFADTSPSAGMQLPASTTLTEGTTYFWRVKALTPTEGDWSTVGNFTVAAEATATATATQPTVTETTITWTQPPVTTQTTVVNETAPAYIWAIIVVGAILVIAVIVLIVRTRRSV